METAAIFTQDGQSEKRNPDKSIGEGMMGFASLYPSYRIAKSRTADSDNQGYLNKHSEISLKFGGNVRVGVMFYPRSLRRTVMKKLGYVIAALGALIIAAPSIASAQTVVIKRGGVSWSSSSGHGARAEFRGIATAAIIADGGMVIIAATRS